jgi:hypothetical protein
VGPGLCAGAALPVAKAAEALIRAGAKVIACS